MIEFTFVLYILFLFIFPVPTLSATLGAVTCYFLFRKHYLLRQQPAAGKKLLGVYWALGFMNFALSLGLAVILALMVYFFIFDNYVLFLFNFILCFFISLRWFDYAHGLFRAYVLHEGLWTPHGPNDPAFGLVIGLRPHSGWGLGLVPVFLDAGPIRIEDSAVAFEGLFFRESFRRGRLAGVRQLSSDRVRIVPEPEDRRFRATQYLLVLRDRFYPFKSRPLRDRLFARLQPATEEPVPAGEAASPLPARPGAG